MKVKYELMREQDCQEVAKLLQANSQSQNGGLLGEFPLHKVNAMYLDSLSTFIARSDNLIVGVVFSFSTSSTTLPPLAHFIIDNYQPLLFNSWLYGPVCIHKDFRGNHILEGLYQHICAANSGQPIAFINTNNIQSLKAHKKLNMNEIERFVFNQTAYILVQGQ